MSSFAADFWSSANTWDDGVPSAGELVVIPKGHSVVLDMDPPECGGVLVEGELIFGDKDLSLSADWILVDGGSLRIGSEASPHPYEAVITLTRSPEGSGEHPHMGGKFLAVANGGRLELHGMRASAANWVQLDAHALAGVSKLVVDTAVDWVAGDRLVIAPSGFDPNEAEEVVVTSVSDRMIQFSPALQYDHWGELQAVGGQVLDERAEVACLTRNIVVQGGEDSAASEFGGHMMFGAAATIHVEGVELRRMGQKGHAARYPVHWHLAGDREGDYARGNSIHESYHRGIVTHGSSNILIEGNVCYDVYSHTYVPSEDGTERGNRFIGNLGILTKRLALEDYTFPESASGASFQSEGRPGVFWMRNPDHILMGNHAAGVDHGMGFFFDGPALGSRWDGVFSKNVAHACSGPSGTLGDRYPGFTVGYGLFMEAVGLPDEIVFESFTAYKNALSGIWLEGRGQTLKNSVLADNGTGAIVFQATVEDSVIVGQSGNAIGELPQIGTGMAGGVHLPASPIIKAPILRNIAFIDQRDAGIVMLGSRLHPLSELEGLSFIGTHPLKIADVSNLVGGFTDLDGSVKGDGVPVYIHGNDALVLSEDSSLDAEINAWVSPLENLNFLGLSLDSVSDPDIGYTAVSGGGVFGELNENGLVAGVSTRSGYVKRGVSYQLLRFEPLSDGIQISLSGGASESAMLQVAYLGQAFIYGGVQSVFGDHVPDFEQVTVSAGSFAELASNLQQTWYLDNEADFISLRVRVGEPLFVFHKSAGGLDATDSELVWMSQNFGYKRIVADTEGLLWGALSDPDGDGMSNRLEFFLDTNPIVPESAIDFSPSLARLSFPINENAGSMEYAVLYSHDLTTWKSDTSVLKERQLDGSFHVSGTVPSSAISDPLFMKLRVGRTTPAALSSVSTKN